jgi:hypothetical protein
MACPTSGTSDNPEAPRGKGGSYSKGIPAAATDDTVDAAYSKHATPASRRFML